MRAQKRDANEASVVEALQNLGCSVDQLPGGNGRPDLLARDPKIERLYLIEVKQPGEKLNALQKKWHAKFGGPIHVVFGAYDAIEIIQHYRAVGR